jgi:predicted Zn-dependent protease
MIEPATDAGEWEAVSEAAADAFAAATLAKPGRPAKPMGELLLRITGPEADGATAILHAHPLSQERLDYLAARDKGPTGRPRCSAPRNGRL